MSTIAQRVEAGAAWLDGVYPGWDEHVDPWSLDMAHGERCILGQLGNSNKYYVGVLAYREEAHWTIQSTYGVVADMHHLDYDSVVDYGFVVPEDNTEDNYMNELNGRWLILLVAREGRRLSRDT